MKNNGLYESDAAELKLDDPSECLSGKRTSWVIASEVAGIEGMPTTDRRARDELERLSTGKEGVKRKRSGTKAFEYHISILPQYVLEELQKRWSFTDEMKVKHVIPVATEEGRPAQYEPTFLDEFALIPGYRVQVSAGYGALSPEYEAPVRHLAFRRKWLKWRGFNESDLAIVWCKGDSMEPTISDNNSLVVHTGRTRPVDGHIYVVRNDDQLWVKRVQVLPGAWLLISDNKHYRPITIHKDEQHAFQVIGQVVHISKDVGE